MARKFSARERVLTVLRGRTQKEAAKILRVSPRTIRRWKNEDVRPSNDYDKRLSRVAARERDRIRRDYKDRGEDLPPGGYIPEGHRRRLKNYVRGKPDGTYRDSEWLNYNVAEMTLQEILDLIKWGRDQGYTALQVIYHVPKGGTSLGGREYKKAGNAMTVPEDLTAEFFEDDAGILDYLNEVMFPGARDRGGKKRSIKFIAFLTD